MMPKPKYIVILTGLSCSVLASGTSHFYSFFRKYFGKGCLTSANLIWTLQAEYGLIDKFRFYTLLNNISVISGR